MEIQRSKPKILIIEDNADTRRFLTAMLGKEFEIFDAENGVIGIELARNRAPDLILLDLCLPILSGFDACSMIKKDEKTKHIPIIFLSPKNQVADVSKGLAAGADDYIPKPFDYKELLARIKARLRLPTQESVQMLIIGDLKIDPSQREVHFQGKKIQLTLTEFDLLRLLATHHGQVVPREEILKGVWKDDSQNTNDRTIDVHIRALRRKIPEMSKNIHSIYGVGYKYEI